MRHLQKKLEIKVMKNEIEHCGDFYIAKMSRGYAFKFDKVDLAIVLMHSWYPSRQGAQVYPTNRNGVTFHRLLFPETQEGLRSTISIEIRWITDAAICGSARINKTNAIRISKETTPPAFPA